MGWFRKLAFWRKETVEEAVVQTVTDEITGCFTLPETAALDGESVEADPPPTPSVDH